MGATPQRIGNYRIAGVAGSTTSGLLLRAEHVALPRRAIVKVTHAAVTGMQLAVQLLREACLLEALPHPGVPRVYETGLLPDRRPWFAVERIDGVALAARFGKGALPAAEIAWLLRDLAEILEHAHRRGIVHYALRPEVIVLDARGIHVVDWSDARTHDAPRDAQAATYSDPYTAPELAIGDPVDDRSDVYALGAIAYQALTGAVPCAHPAIAERGPFARLIEQMLSRAAYDRPSSSEVRAELDAMEMPQYAAPVEDVERSAPRIRKPRWTPASLPEVGLAHLSAPLIDGVRRKH